MLCCILLLQAGHAWIFIREVRAWKELSEAVRLTVVAIIVALFFSGANLDNFTWPFQISFILAFYAGTVSLYALIRYAEECGKHGTRFAWAWLAASAGSAFVATHSLANGILIWPVLLLMAAVLRLHRRILLLLGIVFVLVSLQYFYGYQRIAGHVNAVEALRHPIEVLAYIGAYLAIPVAKINHAVGAVVGLAGLGAFAWTAFRMVRRRELPRLVLLNLGVMLYIFAGACVTALGRMAVAQPEAALRYATPVSIFWACALLLALAEAETFQFRSTAVAAVLATVITGLIVAVVPMHLERCSSLIEFTQSIRDAEVALRTNVDAKTQIGAIYPDPEFAFSLVDVLRDHHRSLFAGSQLQVGEPLRPEYQMISRDRCRGVWELTAILDGGGKPGNTASGWAWDIAANRQPKGVLFIDNARTVRGFAVFTRAREDLALAFRDSRMASSGWAGFTRRGPGPPPQAFALLSDGRSLCQLGSSAEIPGPLFAVFRQGQWMINSTRSGVWQPEDRSLQFGLTGDFPVAGDWDGSGVVRAGTFRDGQWYLDWNNSGRWDQGDRQISFGAPGDLPVVGDWNHSGVTKVGVFRNGTWILDWNGEQRYGSGARQFTFGAPGDLPVVGDWDGSGGTRIGVFRRGVWYLDNGDFQMDNRDKVAIFGLPDDQPVTGDWSGIGVTKIGVFRNGLWILDSDGKLKWDPQDASARFGLPGDIALSWGKK